jgi:hypothetical protein
MVVRPRTTLPSTGRFSPGRTRTVCPTLHLLMADFALRAVDHDAGRLGRQADEFLDRALGAPRRAGGGHWSAMSRMKASQPAGSYLPVTIAAKHGDGGQRGAGRAPGDSSFHAALAIGSPSRMDRRDGGGDVGLVVGGKVEALGEMRAAISSTPPIEVQQDPVLDLQLVVRAALDARLVAVVVVLGAGSGGGISAGLAHAGGDSGLGWWAGPLPGPVPHRLYTSSEPIRVRLHRWKHFAAGRPCSGRRVGLLRPRVSRTSEDSDEAEADRGLGRWVRWGCSVPPLLAGGSSAGVAGSGSVGSGAGAGVRVWRTCGTGDAVGPRPAGRWAPSPRRGSRRGWWGTGFPRWSASPATTWRLWRRRT